MIDVTSSNAILSIRHWNEIFSRNVQTAHKEYKMLSKMWHPDQSNDPLATDVFAHLNSLYRALKTQTQQPLPELTFSNKKFSYYKQFKFEMGTGYLSRDRVVYVFDEQWSSRASEASIILSSIEARIRASPKLLEACGGSFLWHKDILLSDNGKSALNFNRTEPIYRISDILAAKGIVEQKHVAWIISRLCNFLCILYSLEYCHNGITLDNCYINPENHRVYVVGGWQYASKIGSKIKDAPSDVFKIMPISVKNSKLASIGTDIESIKEIGRRLTAGQKIPDAFSDWLWSSNKNTPYDEFSKWDESLIASYGKRTFIKFELSEEEIFN